MLDVFKKTGRINRNCRGSDKSLPLTIIVIDKLPHGSMVSPFHTSLLQQVALHFFWQQKKKKKRRLLPPRPPSKEDATAPARRSFIKVRLGIKALAWFVCYFCVSKLTNTWKPRGVLPRGWGREATKERGGRERACERGILPALQL